jgi:hypothetical protein
MRRARRIALPVLVCLLVATTARAAQTRTAAEPVVARDPIDAPADGFELTRVQLARGDDGRLRGALTLGRAWRTRDLPADDGPPGSLCLRLWTGDGDPAATAAGHLVCVTSDASGTDLRGSVLAERDGDLVRVAGATLTRSSARTVVVRFAQSAVGRPAVVRFAGEATAPGCGTAACVDTAPNAPATATLTLRTS